MKKSFALAFAAALAAPLVIVAPLLSAGPASGVVAQQNNRVVGWVSCDGGTEVLTYKPRRHVMSCADANSGLRRLDWSSWTKSAAMGAGTYYWNDCSPNCAAGTTHSSKATVKLTRPTIQHGEKVFTKVTIRYIDEDGMMQADTEDSLPWHE